MSGIVLILAAALGQAPTESALPPKQKKALDAVCKTYSRGGSPVALLDLLTPVVSGANKAQLEEIELRLRGEKLPPLAELLHNARMLMAQQGLSRELPRAGTREAMLVIPELKRDIDEVLILAEDHLVMADPLLIPQTMDEYHEIFWKIHVLGNKLETTRRLAQYMVDFGQGIPRNRYEQLDEATRELLELDYPQEALAACAAYEKKMKEREIELRIRRLGLVDEVLADPEISKAHVLAAASWQVDKQLATEFLQKKPRGGFDREFLNAKNLIRQVAANANRAERAAGDLTDKADLFMRALHWWTRARYGEGPEIFGLAKSEAAMRTELGQFALFMPQEPPKAVDPFGSKVQQASSASDKYGAVPKYDRRHLYWWAWEDRSVSEVTAPMTYAVPFW